MCRSELSKSVSVPAHRHSRTIMVIIIIINVNVDITWTCMHVGDIIRQRISIMHYNINYIQHINRHVFTIIRRDRNS